MSANTPDRQALSQNADRFLQEPKALFIDGAWTPAHSGETIEILNPSTGARLGAAARGDARDIDRAVRAARTAFESGAWSSMPAAGRRQLMLRLADKIEETSEELAWLETLNCGMPLALSGWMARINAPECLRHQAGWTDRLGGDTLPAPPGQHFYTLKQPVGVVGAIVPWNAPLMITVWKLASALAAGCTVVLKPSELTPFTAIRLAQLIEEVGFPPGVVNVVTGLGDPAGKALAEHPGVDKITFTGSTAVGRSILNAASGNFKRVTLELGGKSPVLIFPDADIDRAAAAAAMGIFINSGQVCAAGSRLYAHKKVYDRVVGAVVEAASKLKIAPGTEPGADLGPLISEQQRERVAGYIGVGVEQGAEIVAGGRKLERPGFFLEPTVLAQTNNTMRVVQEEIFGPVLCAMPIDDDDLEAIVARANDSPYGLSSSVWTRDLGLAHTLARRLKAGTVSINGGAAGGALAPFGGFKQSGWGREHGREGVEGYLETKSVMIGL